MDYTKFNPIKEVNPSKTQPYFDLGWVLTGYSHYSKEGYGSETYAILGWDKSVNGDPVFPASEHEDLDVDKDIPF